MSENYTASGFDGVDVAPVEIDTSRKDLMDRWGVSSPNTIKAWNETLGFDRNKKQYTPTEVALLEDLRRHVQDEGWTLKRYQERIGRSQPEVTPDESHGYYSPQPDDTENGSAISQVARSRYQNAVASLAKPLAQQFWNDLDKAVLAEVANLAKSHQSEVTAIEATVLAEFEANPLLLLPSDGDGLGC